MKRLFALYERLQAPLAVQGVSASESSRKARTCVSAEAVTYPGGLHVRNNIPFFWRPLAADWLAEKLAS